jgi:hypothetical protein
MISQNFSGELKTWLTSKQPKTIESLNETFKEKGFAIIFLILMFLPALPLPTGGISHVFEIIVMLLSLEMLTGRDTIWLPKRWRNLRIRGVGHPRVANKIVSYVERVEKFARPRYSHWFSNRVYGRGFALMVLLFTVFAFVPIPFLGLDTLPSLGVVLMSLAFIFEDALLFVLGILAGAAGIAIEFTLGAGAFRALNHLF